MLRHIDAQWRVGVMCLALCAVYLVACQEQNATRLSQGPHLARNLPQIDAADLKGMTREGGSVLVALWATWCDPCLREFAILDAFASSRRDLVVLGLATEDVKSPVAAGRIDAVFQRLNPRYPQGHIRPGGEHELLSALGLEWDGILPKTFVLRPDGRATLIDAYDAATLAAEIRRLESP